MDRVLEPERMDIPERADAYARTDFSNVNAAFVARLTELAGSHGACRAIDLGTGPGEVPRRLAALRPEWRIVAADASMPMLRHARAADVSSAGRAAILCADAKQLPFGDASFDIVFSNSLLHHLPDPLPFWREVRRLARTRAVVLVRDLVRPAEPRDAQHLVDTYARDEHTLLREDFYNSFLAAFTLEEIREQVCEAGLNLTVKQVTDRHVDVYGKV